MNNLWYILLNSFLEDSFKVKELTQDLVDAKATLESCQDHLTQLQKESGTNQRSLQHALQQMYVHVSAAWKFAL